MFENNLLEIFWMIRLFWGKDIRVGDEDICDLGDDVICCLFLVKGIVGVDMVVFFLRISIWILEYLLLSIFRIDF